MKWITRLLKICIIKIHILTLLYIFLSVIYDTHIIYLLYLFIVCIHEFGHTMMAYYFHFHIDFIEILPFGAYLSLKDLYFHPIFEELCVVLAGPATHFFIYLFISFQPIQEIKEQLFLFNSFVFYFNLLPVYPMDGYRLISLLLQYTIDLKKSLYFSLKISVFALAVLTIFYIRTNTLVIIVFLWIQQFYCFKYISLYLREFFSKCSFLYKTKTIKLHKNMNYRRGFTNCYMINNKIYNEEDVIFELLKNIKKV